MEYKRNSFEFGFQTTGSEYRISTASKAVSPFESKSVRNSATARDVETEEAEDAFETGEENDTAVGTSAEIADGADGGCPATPEAATVPEAVDPESATPETVDQECVCPASVVANPSVVDDGASAPVWVASESPGTESPPEEDGGTVSVTVSVCGEPFTPSASTSSGSAIDQTPPS